MDRMQTEQEAKDLGRNVTGGTMVPTKSWFSPNDFELHTKGEWRYRTIEEKDVTCKVKDNEENHPADV